MSVLLFALSAGPALAATAPAPKSIDLLSGVNTLTKLAMSVAASLFLVFVVYPALGMLGGRRHGDLGRHMLMATLVALPCLAGAIFLGLESGIWHKVH